MTIIIAPTNKDKAINVPNNSPPVLRVGFLGAANICKKNALAIHNKSSNCKWTALASRSKDKAQSFIHQCLDNNSIDNKDDIIIFDNYDELVNSQNIVDAIYIPLPTTLHKEWVIKCLQAKKHVLLEKPAALSKDELATMMETAKTHQKFLMDGTMFIHNTRTKKFLNSIHTDKNNIKEIKSEFTFLGDASFWKNNIRLSKDCDPFGCIGDLGWYCTRMALIITKHVSSAEQKQLPSSAQVTNFKCNDDGVPIDATCLVYFDDVLCSFHCSFLQKITDIVEVYDTNQKLIAKIDKFVLPPTDNTLNFESSSSSVGKNIVETNNIPQEVLMWKNFSNIAKNIDKDGCWNEEALDMIQMSYLNQKIIDALMESISCDGKVVNIV